MINSASLLNCNSLMLKEDLDQLVEGGTPMFHIDLMDGHYVPNLAMTVKMVADLKKQYPQILMDVHIMVDNPSAYVKPLADAGADYVSFHTDATRYVRRVINELRAAGVKPGILINPSQRIDHIEPFIKYVDMVTLMTVEPGFAGQPFLEGGMERLQEIADLRKKHGCNFLINVDGGIDYEKGRICKEIGVDVIVGTVHNIFKQPDGLVEACRRFNREFN